MTRSTKILLLGTVIFGAAALGAPASKAAGIPAGSASMTAAAPALVSSVHHRRWHRTARYRYRRGPYLVVRPEPRGFYDQGYAYHGNINGCAVDLGYGRYEFLQRRALIVRSGIWDNRRSSARSARRA